MKKGILLINVGSPDAPTKTAVKSYLTEFLNDPFVIEMPALLRKILVNGIIVPFRSGKSARRYQTLWTEQGSPLVVHLENLKTKLQESIGDNTTVFAAMSYGQPSLKSVLQDIEEAQLDELIVLPLYPHYTKATTLSAKHAIYNLTSEWSQTKIQFIDSFYKENAFIKAVADKAKDFDMESYDHILFSYHSLPLKQVKASCASSEKSYCYDKACYETSVLLAKELKLSTDQYSTTFQSRFAKNWLAPFTSDALKELAQQGKKNILVFTPSFVADCLETTVEIGIEYRDYFIENGGKKLDLVTCPNDSKVWVKGIADIISKA